MIADVASFVAIGTICGLALAMVSSRVLQSMLFDTTAADVLTLILVPVVLGVVAALAALAPAYRASRTDPLIVLRAE